jgi:hypothetical protein
LRVIHNRGIMRVLIKNGCRGAWSLPTPRPTESRGTVDTTSVAEKIRKLEERYAHELLPTEERLELRERILKLRKKLAAAV